MEERYYKYREQYDSEQEEEPYHEVKDSNPALYCKELVDIILITSDKTTRIDLICELFSFVLSHHEFFKNCSEGVYSRFASTVRSKCSEFSTDSDIIDQPHIIELMSCVANTYN